MSKVWLITGAGSGLGRYVAEVALMSGARVVACARTPAGLAPLSETAGNRLLPFELDVRDEAAAQAAVDRAVEVYGRLDVLVNNAGYQFNAPFEQISSDRFRDVLETCLYGVINTARAAVPVMRKQRSGCIFQVSSIGGRVTMPGNSPYHAAKFAVGGFSDSLAAEVEPFGVKVCTLEPGGIQTDFRRRAGESLPPLLADYEPSVGPVYERMADAGARSENDPKRIAELLVRLAESGKIPRHLILGGEALAYVKKVESDRAEEMDAFKELTLSTSG